MSGAFWSAAADADVGEGVSKLDEMIGGVVGVGVDEVAVLIIVEIEDRNIDEP